jgi:ribosomal protein L11 methyltransferase
MNPSRLCQVSITTSYEAEEALLNRLQILFGLPAVSYTDLETRLTTVSVFLPKRPRKPALTRAQLGESLREIHNCGLDPGPGIISLRRVPRRNWTQSWKRHFAPLEIASTLLLKPTWSRRRPRTGQISIILDPGLSFGTGRHPTTAFCLQQLVANRRAGPESFLDLGTGSGILAIAAAKLGYAPVHAVDIDPQALLTSRANARKNRVASRVRFSRADINRLPSRPANRYSLVCANLTADLLLACLTRIVARIQPAGILVLSGILKTEFPQIQNACQAAGLRLVTARSATDWRSGAFELPEA